MSKWRVRLTSAVLENNHGVSPDKIQYHKSNSKNEFSSEKNVEIEWSNQYLRQQYSCKTEFWSEKKVGIEWPNRYSKRF